MDKTRALAIAHEWVEAFNRHDLEAILSHHAESVALTSLLATRVLGKPALRAYFAKALAASPSLKFELLDVFTGVNSVAVYFRHSIRGLQIEIMELDADGRITRVLVHHRDP